MKIKYNTGWTDSFYYKKHAFTGTLIAQCWFQNDFFLEQLCSVLTFKYQVQFLKIQEKAGRIRIKSLINQKTKTLEMYNPNSTECFLNPGLESQGILSAFS